MSEPLAPGQMVRLIRMGGEAVVGEVLWERPDGTYRVDIDPDQPDMDTSTIVCARRELIPLEPPLEH